MKELIERLEAATEGSRDFDEDIALAIGLWKAWKSKHRYWNFDGPGGLRFSWPYDPQPRYSSETGEEIKMGEIPWHGWGDNADLPEYTTSLDAALTLAGPPGHPLWTWTVNGRIGASIRHNFYQAEITVPSSEFRGIAPTPALALCIACLRARSAK